MNIRNLKEAFSSGRLLFICQSCGDELNGRSIRRYIDEQQQTQPPPLAALPAQVQQLSDVVAVLSKKIDDLTDKPHPRQSVSVTPSWPKLGVKRPRNERPDIGVPVVQGTKTIDLSDLSVPSISPTVQPEKFWLYLSRLNPLITDNDVQNIVSRCLDITDPAVVVRLVPKGMDVSRMTFVSFKIGLDPSVRNTALDPASWPAGLQFREFVDIPKN